MKTVGGLFALMCSKRWLLQCLRRTAKGKRHQAQVAWCLFRQDAVVQRLSGELSHGSWRPMGFDILRIRDPKRRAIARAPFEDRIVHTAVARLLEPTFLRSADDGDLACRPGGGTHRAVARVHGHMRRHRFALHLDIRSYFPSIDPDLALCLVARRVRDRPFLAVLERILDGGRGLIDRHDLRAWLGLSEDWPPRGVGLPVGAYSSQLLATHVYLQALDHHIKRRLKVPGYTRFVDDLLIFGDRRADMRSWRAAIGEWLWDERRLRLKHPFAPVLSCAGHFDALGMRIRRSGAVPLARAERRFRQRVWQAARRHDGDPEVLRGSIAASVAHLLEGAG